ncbi:ATP-binding cassette-type vacuolar membrane transporter Hmt1 [Stygiomarasmius scandens]|uniref:ATP-binding cassette-type vacuolar membrane transporter Hmt1 n=1 Tax=Marasmiellus scandens TaxID=2682957 RepID=A0ABR1K6R4_9AGAR
MLSTTGIPFAVFILRILSPAFVLLPTFSLFFLRPALGPTSPSPITSVVVANRVPRRALVLLLLSLASLTYLGDGLAFVVYAILQKHWPWRSGVEINAILGVVSFSGLAALGAWKDVHGIDVWALKRLRLAVVLSLGLDIALVVLLGLHSRQTGSPSTLPIRVLLHLAFPVFRVILLLPLFVALSTPRIVYTSVSPETGAEEQVPTDTSLLLPQDAAAQPSTGLLTVPGLNADQSKYGTFRPSRSQLQQSAPTTRTPSPSRVKTDEKPEISTEPSWSEMYQRLKRLSPYLWPSKSRSLQLIAIICLLILAIGRVVNLVVPFTYGEIIKFFEGRSEWSLPVLLGVYVVFRFLQGSGGLNALRDSLWAPVMQYSDREMSQLSFNHLLNLSFAFHTRRRTGEILRVLDRGAVINHTLELILFNLLPTFVDIVIALVVFIITFEWTLALVIFVVMVAYVSASVLLTQWRTRIRRQMNERDIITRGIHTDCLLNYETVKYFGGEEHEAARYQEAIREYQALEYKVIVSLNLLNLIQNFIITAGLLVGSMIVALRITQGEADPSTFVVFITYLAQLYAPLNQLGYTYRSMNQSLVDTEKLLKLLNEPTDINDMPNAPDLVVDHGEIEFDNVSFSYDGRTTALKGVSFKVPKNSSVALVGESGSGKSTILRLLYRFYDLQEGQGRILIDGKDIREVTQKSLRQAIGVVPQDSVLFNTTIRYNIGYGKFGASDEEIEDAARSAQMHDRIMSFPLGYDTVVGERGVRLSGGEKQRVAIARTLLKNPPILLLDEATSALDTSTERDIQKALQNLMMGRSSLSIAHRLSTIASADLILVLKDGQIVEQGSHKELLATDGIFASMWAEQVSATEDPAVSIQSTKPEVTGYSVGASDAIDAAVENQEEVVESSQAPQQPSTHASEPEAPIAAEPEEPPAVPPKVTEPSEEAQAPVAFPTSEDEAEVESPSPAEASSPDVVAFPTSTDAPMSAPPTPGVTFETNNHPSRSGTPDPDSEPKRKRISSQNFQRIARRISISTARREGSVSSMIPGFMKKDKEASPKVSTDDGGERSARGSTNESPSPSVNEDSKKKKSSKKEKRRTNTGSGSTS